MSGGARMSSTVPSLVCQARHDPDLTPYAIAPSRMVHGRTHKRVVFVCGGQMGKSVSILHTIGGALRSVADAYLYVGPTKEFIRDQWEPRIMDMLDNTPLSDRVVRGRRAKVTRKVISGVVLRLAGGGSSSGLKSDPFGLCVTDEADELMANVKGAGDPIRLIDVRGETHADFVHYITSTPSEGPSEVDVDQESGLRVLGRGRREGNCVDHLAALAVGHALSLGVAVSALR